MHGPAARVGAVRRLAAALLTAALAVPVLATAAPAGGNGASAPASPSPLRIVDDRGQTVTLARPPQRIVTLLPSLTETVCTLGACARLVGVDRWSNWPASVTALPRLGGLDDLSVEAVLRLQPDLVLASRAHRVLERLQALGVPTAALDGQNHDDIRRHLLAVATLLGQPESGTAAWGVIQDQLAQAARRVPARWQGRRAYVEISTAPHAASAGSFIGETLTRLGLQSIVPASMGPFPQLSPEFILKAQPDVVIGVAREVAAMPRRPGWSTLHALRDQQVCALEAGPWDLVVRPGPRLGEAAIAIAACLEQRPTGGAQGR
jgi:iron complex transport system substrate-binding protein